MTEKRDIKELIQQEETHLNNLLEPNDLKSFKGMVDELRDTWTKKQIFRTETEMKVAVLEHVSSFLSIYSTDVLNSLYEEFIEGDATGNLDKSHQIMTVSKKLLEIPEDNNFDLVSLYAVLEHVPNPVEVFEQSVQPL